MRLRHQGLAVGADEVEILDGVGQIPAVIERLPLALAAEPAHRRRRAALVLVGERLDRRPPIELVREGVQLAVDLVDHRVLADQARHQAAPAAVRVDVAHLLVEGDDLLALVAELVVPPPELAELVVPARVLGLEPLEVPVGLGLDAPEVHRPADGEELRHLVHVELLGQPVPGFLHVVMVDLDAVLLERQHVGAVVVLEDPAVPHLRVGLLVLVTVGGAVFDERSDRRVDDGVVLPEGVAQVALEKQVVLRLLEGRHQQRVTVADVPRTLR
eukprot:TRINITY_DN1353_c0_g1_i4.p2 TRINITY_DN1353_c0_g1~~TRINITY_DN1353_c0_g1_i4.p2  ORF type:complete len:272 (+),score=3.79 TRINITY_DN1353_c0_g1_i4:572-1387(+)